MNRRGGAAAAVAAVLGILFTLFTPSPAAAAAAGSIETPAPSEVIETSEVRISGRLEARDGGRFVSDIVLDVGGQHFAKAFKPEGEPFEWPVTFPANGTYKAVVTVMYQEWPYQLNTPYKIEHEREFHVDAAPAAVTGLSVTPNNADRSIKVSWKPNAEPDLLLYVVQRSFNSKTAYADLGSIKAGEPTSFVDKLTDNDPAGTYRYRVIAFRKDWTGEDVKFSPATTSKDAPIKAQPASGSTTPVTGSNGIAASPGQPAGSSSGSAPVVGSNGKVNIGKLNNLLSQPSLGADPTSPGPRLTPEAELPEEEDGAYSDRLPYGPDGIPGTEDDGEGDMSLGVDEPVSSTEERPTTLLSLGGAALAAMLVALTRWVLNEVKRSEDELPAVDVVHVAIPDHLPIDVMDVEIEEVVTPQRAARPLRSPMRPRRDAELVGSATE